MNTTTPALLGALGPLRKAVLRACQRGRARLASSNAPLVRRAMHQVAAPSSAHWSMSASMTYDAAPAYRVVGVEIESPAGLTSSQCRPVMAMPASAGRGARRGELGAARRCGLSDSV